MIAQLININLSVDYLMQDFEILDKIIVIRIFWLSIDFRLMIFVDYDYDQGG